MAFQDCIGVHHVAKAFHRLPPAASSCANFLGCLHRLGCRLPTLDSRDGNRQPSTVGFRLPMGTPTSSTVSTGECVYPTQGRGRKFANCSKFTGGCTHSKSGGKRPPRWSPSVSISGLPRHEPVLSDEAESLANQALAYAFSELKNGAAARSEHHLWMSSTHPLTHRSVFQTPMPEKAPALLDCGCATLKGWSCRFRASRGMRVLTSLRYSTGSRLRASLGTREPSSPSKAVASFVPHCATAVHI